jgi:hypothetical protein
MKQVTIIGAGRAPQTVLAPDSAGKVIDAEALQLAVPTVGIFRWTPAGDGTFRPKVLIQETMIRAVVLARLVEMDQKAMHRLAAAGFVRWDRPTPNNLRISVESWLEHQAKVQADPWFWEKAANRNRFSEAL